MFPNFFVKKKKGGRGSVTQYGLNTYNLPNMG